MCFSELWLPRGGLKRFDRVISLSFLLFSSPHRSSYFFCTLLSSLPRYFNPKQPLIQIVPLILVRFIRRPSLAMEFAAKACPFLRNSTASALRSLSQKPAKTAAASNGLVHMAQQCPVMGKAMTIQARSALAAGGCPASAGTRHFSASAAHAKPAKSQILGYASALSSNDIKASVQHELHKANPAPGAGTNQLLDPLFFARKKISL